MSESLRDDLESASRLPDGEGKVAALERLAAHADAAGDTRLGFDVRFALIDAYANHTQRWRLLPSFVWCLAAFDRDPSLYDEWDAEMLRWYHKWAIATLSATPRVGLAQTMSALDDMERRYREGGHSLHAVYNLRCRIADHVGDIASAQRYFQLWRTARRDENSDCAGCDPARQAELLTRWGREAEAIEIIEPVLSGMLGCAEQPEKALVAVLAPYLRLERFTEAAAAHVRSYRRHRYERDAFPYLADHLKFCALTGNVERGLSILEEHLPWLDEPYDDYSAMEFAASAALVARLAIERGVARPVHRPALGDRAAADLTPEQVWDQLGAIARALAVQFDARNGTGHQSQRIEAWLADRPLRDGLELPPDEPAREAQVSASLPPQGRQDLLSPLSVEAIRAALTERGDRFIVDDDGTVAGRWAGTLIYFDRTGGRGELLHIRSVADRRFTADRLPELYEFCNGWNHDRLLPKAYVHDNGDGELLVIGESTTDLEHGISASQLAVIIRTAIAAAAALADSLDRLP